MKLSIKTIVCISVIVCIVSLDHRFETFATSLKNDELIFLAAQYGDGPEIERLIQSGVKVNSINNLGFTPLYLAIFHDHVYIVDLLLRKGADVNLKISSGFSPLFLASSEGNLRAVEILIRYGANVNIKNNDDWTPLHTATAKGYDRIVEMLIQKGADVNCKMNMGWTPILFASSEGHEKIVNLLLQNGANVNFKKSDGRTALHTAAQKGFINIVDMLIKNGADVNGTTLDGWTPLLFAVHDGHISIAQLIIDKGADINHKADGGLNAAHLAAQKGQYEMLKWLILNGADIYSKLDNGWLPIHTAAANDHEDIIGLLFRSGVDIDIKTSDGRTPLYVATEYGHVNVVNGLFSFGADCNIKADNGKTPSNIAAEKGFTTIVELLSVIARPALEACQQYMKLASNRILGGVEAEAQEFPWMAAVGYIIDEKLEFNCGGTLISDNYVLSAAHCVRKNRTPTIVRLGKLRLGDNDTSSNDYDIEEITRHSNFSLATLKNDIVLFRLAKRVNFTDDIIPACLHLDMDDVFMNGKLLVTGWGSTSAYKTHRPNQLLKAQLATMSLSECNTTLYNVNKDSDLKSLRSGLSESQYCAYDPQGRNDSCQGDSGGPLQFISSNISIPSTIVGIISFGVSCGTAMPSVYTRVAYYLDWIESIVWPSIE